MAPMGSVRQTRGRLPRRVYWVRRAVVLGVALLLVFGIGKLLGGTGSDDPGATQANVTSGGQAPAASVTLGPAAPSRKLGARAKPPLLPASGDCRDDEIRVRPSVTAAYASKPITIMLSLEGSQPACNFEVSAQSLVVKITSGADRIWSSQDCTTSIPKTQVVVRSGQPVVVPVTWSGRRSDEGCTDRADWALLGFYHVYAAAQGSAASDVQFEVTRFPTVTKTPKPKPKRGASASPAQPPSATATPSGKASPKP